MNVNGRPMRTIWLAEDGGGVEIIDQRLLPHELVVARLQTLDDAARAIRDMAVRGAPLIGATAAYGVALGAAADASDDGIALAIDSLAATRPTAVNLHWALEAMRQALAPLPPRRRHEAALAKAAEIAEEDVAINRAIGEHGLPL
ncbi:MAG TPA: S-methyl-5-thioribose-1-phosphate isomerase, partial [Stellaceae bacterium]|nr:S-methyl-5-thioribose-1-phosphate isomerase [Stellaceae bacterium]